MKCKYCNAELKQGAKFCPHCGKSVSDSNTCVKCGKSIKTGATFCPFCGAKQELEIETEVVQEKQEEVSEMVIPQPVVKETDLPESKQPDVKQANETIKPSEGVKEEAELPVSVTEKREENREEKRKSKAWIWILLGFLVVGAAVAAYYFSQPSNDTSLGPAPEEESPAVSGADEVLIKDFYRCVLGDGLSDEDLDRFLSPNLKKSLWTEDYEGCYEFWRFRTTAQDYSNQGDINGVKQIRSLGDGWYQVDYLDMGWNGHTKVRVKNGKIVSFEPDSSWTQLKDSAEEDVPTENDLSPEEGQVMNGSFTLHGVVDKYPITMTLTVEGTAVKGSYYYNSQGPDRVLTLSGGLNNGVMDIYETDENDQQTGHFHGTFANGVYRGDFETQGKTMSFVVAEK